VTIGDLGRRPARAARGVSRASAQASETDRP